MTPVRMPLVALVLVSALGAAGAAKATSEDDLKAAFVLTISRFVEWPPEALGDGETPLSFCVIGRESLQAAFVSAPLYLFAICFRKLIARVFDLNTAI